MDQLEIEEEEDMGDRGEPNRNDEVSNMSILNDFNRGKQ